MSEPHEAAAPHPRRGWSGWALVSAAFLVGFANFPLQTVGLAFDHLPGDVVDNRLNLFVLEHGYRYLRGEVPSFWDIGAYYPVRGVTAWSDAHIGMLPLYAALRACGLSPERAFQGWFLVPFALNFVAAAWAARRLGAGAVGTAVAAYVFAYGLPVAAQLGHAQLYPRFLVPPALALAWEWLRVPRATWRLAAVAACLVYQTYVSVYVGYFLGLTLAASAAMAVVVSRGRLPWRGLVAAGGRVWAARALVAVAAGVALYPLVNAHRAGGSEVTKEHVKLFAPRPLAWVTPPGMAAAVPELAEYTKLGSAVVNAAEQQLMPGLLVLAAVAAGPLLAACVLARGGGTVGVWPPAAAGTCAALLLGLLVTKYGGDKGTWPYEYLLGLPGVSGIRAIGRVVLVLVFPAGFALGVLLDAAVRAAGRRARALGTVAAALALAAVAIDQRLTSNAGARANDWWWARTPQPAAVDRRGRVEAAIRRHPGPKLVYVFPSEADALGVGGWPALQLDAMLAAQSRGLPTANGWSGHAPPDWTFPPGGRPAAGYRELQTWLTVNHATPPEVLDGLVVIGAPAADPDPAYDAAMRARFPPQAVPATP